jgi:hypothetical protein
VSEADVLRLALDGHLKLSVDFVNKAQARRGKVARYSKAELTTMIQAGNLPDDLKWSMIPAELTATLPNIPEDQKGKPITYLASERIDDERYLTLQDDVVVINGVWDLPMIGGEALDVEHEYQMMTGGPAVILEVIDGTVVARGENEFCVLQESFDDNEYQPGSKAELEEIKERIAAENLDKADAEKLLNKHKEDREKYLSRRSENRNNDYFPAGGLPRDAVYVVRTEELRKFEQRFSENNETEKPLKTTERNTLLTIIAALCDYSAIDPQARGTAQKIAYMTQEIGAAVTDDTIRNVIEKIHDALESRKK